MNNRYMDAAILGMPRSGTTMLAGLMTHNQRLILDEPSLFQHDRWRKCSDQVQRASQWGVKEVNADLIDQTLRAFDVQQIVCMVRDAGAILASYYDAVHVHGLPWPRDIAHHADYVAKTASRVMEFAGIEDCRIVYYEQFVRESAERELLAQWLSWPLDGDPGNYQQQRADRKKRMFEVEQHGGQVTDRSIEKRNRAQSAEQKRWIDAGRQACAAYQRRFGFPQ